MRRALRLHRLRHAQSGISSTSTPLFLVPPIVWRFGGAEIAPRWPLSAFSSHFFRSGDAASQRFVSSGAGLRGREEGVPFVAGELKDRAVRGLAVGDQDALLAVLLDRGEEDAVTPGAEPGPRQTREIGHAHMSQPSFEVLVSS